MYIWYLGVIFLMMFIIENISLLVQVKLNFLHQNYTPKIQMTKMVPLRPERFSDH